MAFYALLLGACLGIPIGAVIVLDWRRRSPWPVPVINQLPRDVGTPTALRNHKSTREGRTS